MPLQRAQPACTAPELRVWPDMRLGRVDRSRQDRGLRLPACCSRSRSGPSAGWSVAQPGCARASHSISNTSRVPVGRTPRRGPPPGHQPPVPAQQRSQGHQPRRQLSNRLPRSVPDPRDNPTSILGQLTATTAPGSTHDPHPAQPPALTPTQGQNSGEPPNGRGTNTLPARREVPMAQRRPLRRDNCPGHICA